MTHTARVVWLRVQNPAEVCGLIAASCEMTSRCTDHPGEIGPAPCQTQTCNANAVDEETRGETRWAFIFLIARLAHSLKLKNVANVIHCIGFDTRMCVNITASRSQRKENWDWDYVTSKQRKGHVYAISKMCGSCAKIVWSKLTWQQPASS